MKTIPAFSGNREKIIWFSGCVFALIIGAWFGYSTWAYLHDPAAYPHLKPGTMVPLFWGTGAVAFGFNGLVGLYLGVLRLHQTK